MALAEFRIDVPDSVLDGITRRLADSRIGYAPEDEQGWSHGTSASVLADLVAHWRDRYDWRGAEAALNAFPQYRATIDGILVHFYHLRAGPGAFPIILTHGWPGSVVEFRRAMCLLQAQGFDVVVPSLPGYGWSSRPSAPIGPSAVARLWRRLMTEILGYDRFGAQGGDWGSAVTARLGAEHGDVVAGIHLNLFQALRPTGPDGDEAAYWQAVGQMRDREGAYMMEHMTKPQSIGLALHDHPVGWASWVIEKFEGWRDRRVPFGQSFDRDDLITNLMTYLVNDAIISSIWLYRGALMEAPIDRRIDIPTGLAVYPGEFYPYPTRAAAERAYDVRAWSEMERGGHFAAMEEPDAFAGDVGGFFASLA